MARYHFENKVAVIVLDVPEGLKVAEEFLKKGVKAVVLVDNKEDGAKLVDQLNIKYGVNKIVYIKCDITNDLDTVSKRIFDMYKTVDILINAANTFDEESLRSLITTNVIVTMEWSIRFLEHMREKNNGGTIINLSSVAALRNVQFFPFFRATKLAVYGFSKTLGHLNNFKRHGVRVIVLLVGLTDTVGRPSRTDNMDEQTLEEYNKLISQSIFQKVEVVVEAITEIYEKADSGTAWLSEDNKPVEQVPE